MSALQFYARADTLEAQAFNHPRQQSCLWEDWNSSLVHCDLKMTQKQFSLPWAGPSVFISSACGLRAVWVESWQVWWKGTVRAPEGPREDFHVAHHPSKVTVPETPLMAKPSVSLNVACLGFLFKPEMPVGGEDMTWKPPVKITVASVGWSVTLLWDLRERLQS